MVNQAVRDPVVFSIEIERRAKIVVNFTVRVSGHTLIDIGEATSGRTIPGHLRSDHIHLHRFMSADTLVAVRKSLHILQPDAEPRPMDVESIVRGVFGSDIPHRKI